MDIEYLLFLQNWRNATNNMLTPFMEWVSLFAVTYLILIPIFVYWCLDKKKGLYVLASYGMGIALNAVVKLTACIYRPWIRDARVLPAGDAITTATGYSFPSGHSSTASLIYGGLAVVSWNPKRTRIFAVIAIICMLITGFSRNYLGVHTPQDVCVGLTLGWISLFIMYKIFGYLAEHPEKEDLFLLAGFIIGWIGILYITFKSYPLTYKDDGSLLVDPQKMMNDGYGDIGCLIGFCPARYIEKRWVRFKEAGLNGKGIAVSVVGMVPLYFMIKFLKKALDAALGSHFGHLTYSLIMIFYVITLFPAIIKAVCGTKEDDQEVPRNKAA